jgi:hypothetical protein
MTEAVLQREILTEFLGAESRLSWLSSQTCLWIIPIFVVAAGSNEPPDPESPDQHWMGNTNTLRGSTAFKASAGVKGRCTPYRSMVKMHLPVLMFWVMASTVLGLYSPRGHYMLTRGFAEMALYQVLYSVKNYTSVSIFTLLSQIDQYGIVLIYKRSNFPSSIPN